MYFFLFFNYIFFKYISLLKKRKCSVQQTPFRPQRNSKFWFENLVSTFTNLVQAQVAERNLFKTGAYLCALFHVCVQFHCNWMHLCEWKPRSQYGSAIKDGSFKISTQSVLLLGIYGSGWIVSCFSQMVVLSVKIQSFSDSKSLPGSKIWSNNCAIVSGFLGCNSRCNILVIWIRS